MSGSHLLNIKNRQAKTDSKRNKKKIAIKRAQRKACLPLLSGSDLCKKLVRLKNNMAEKETER